MITNGKKNQITIKIIFSLSATHTQFGWLPKKARSPLCLVASLYLLTNLNKALNKGSTPYWDSQSTFKRFQLKERTREASYGSLPTEGTESGCC
jgi:hypothetical protein